MARIKIGPLLYQINPLAQAWQYYNVNNKNKLFRKPTWTLRPAHFSQYICLKTSKCWWCLPLHPPGGWGPWWGPPKAPCPRCASWPWHAPCGSAIHARCCDQENYSVVVDRYSHWPTMFMVEQGARDYTKHFRRMFSTLGVCHEIATDGAFVFTGGFESSYPTSFVADILKWHSWFQTPFLEPVCIAWELSMKSCDSWS